MEDPGQCPRGREGRGRIKHETFVPQMASNACFWSSAQRDLTEHGHLQGVGCSQQLLTPRSAARDLLADTVRPRGRPTLVNKKRIPTSQNLNTRHLLGFPAGMSRVGGPLRGLFPAGGPGSEVVGLSFPFSFFSLKAKSKRHLPACSPLLEPQGNIFKKQKSSQGHKLKALVHLSTLLLWFLLCRMKGSWPPRCFSAPVSMTLKMFKDVSP